MENEACRRGRQNESQCCQRPDETDVGARQQDQQRAEERGLESDPDEEVAVGGSGADQSEDFTRV